jgi:hypothetical protein
MEDLGDGVSKSQPDDYLHSPASLVDPAPEDTQAQPPPSIEVESSPPNSGDLIRQMQPAGASLGEIAEAQQTHQEETAGDDDAAHVDRDQLSPLNDLQSDSCEHSRPVSGFLRHHRLSLIKGIWTFDLRYSIANGTGLSATF